MLKKTTLKEVPVGTTFEVWNRKYTVLDKANDRAFCLAAEIELNLPFLDGYTTYKVAPNDFRDSSIRNYLNDYYLGALLKDGLQNGQILDMNVDLKCTLGRHEYGNDSVKVGLLTLEEYGKYYDIIPKINSQWWTATPWKTPSTSSNAFHTNYIVAVDCDGDHFDGGFYEVFGVRPALTLSLALLVAWGGEYNGDDDDWEGYIKYLHKWAAEHSDKNFAGSCPVCYAEWQDWERKMQNE